jgi:hypothetical protein
VPLSNPSYTSRETDTFLLIVSAKEEMLIALGLADEDGSTMQFLRSGYKTNTWWEEESEQEQFDSWRT